jgi:hypothetical protein
MEFAKNMLSKKDCSWIKKLNDVDFYTICTAFVYASAAAPALAPSALVPNLVFITKQNLTNLR